MRVFIASDHAGYELKNVLTQFVRDCGHEIVDCGANALDPEDDYPDFVMPLAKKVAAEEGSVGIVLGASGQGEAIAANRVKGIRAGVYYGPADIQVDASGNVLNLVQSMRAHNNANVLSIGARFVSVENAKDAVRLFLETPFSNEARHLRRIAKLDA